MGIRWVINPRTAAFLLQASMCLGPGRWFVGILNPMGQGGLIAPFGELRHDAAMHPRAHEGAHARLVAPHCAGPESAIGIAKDRNREAPIRELRLARRAQRLDHKARQIPPNPNPKSRDGHKRHKPIIPRAEPDLLARRDRGRGARCGPRSRMLASAAVSPATGGCCNRSLPSPCYQGGMTPTEIHSRLYLMGAATLGGMAMVALAVIGLAALMR